MWNGTSKIPTPQNEPVKDYAPGSAEKKSLKKELERQRNSPVEIPLIIGSKKIFTGKTIEVRSPHNKDLVLAKCHQATKEEIKSAITVATKAQKEWSRMPWQARSAVLLKAGDLVARKYRDRINAATMLGQSKTVYQAEIDSACEVIDFFRFNPYFLQRIYEEQPQSSSGQWNQLYARGLEGFVYAVAPFNFTAIAMNLPTAPALMGCATLLKPASTAVLSAYVGMEVLEEAGLPAGVINFVPGNAGEITDAALSSPEFSGLHFTGSTETFNTLWRRIGENLENFKNYPRIVGETGGKDFVFVHASADPQAVSVALVRGSFEYQGQKCSAASRAYIPKSLWSDISARLVAECERIKVGDVEDFTNFMGAVIDKKSFDKIKSYIQAAGKDKDAKILFGGKCDDSQGYFIDPTIIVTTDPYYRTMREEIFGPVLTIYVYDDAKLEETLKLCDEGSPYALTGAIFARDRGVIAKMSEALENSAGNFYINDKPTGAVVGQQPFGGGRKSGTNDKAGSIYNLLRWASMRTVKETFVPPTSVDYPFMLEK